jgi:signal transduction histidine kinase
VNERTVGNLRRAKEFLRPLPLFAELAEEDLDRLCRMARRVRVEEGALVMEEGSPGDGLYIVVEGQLEVTKNDGHGQVVLASRGPGEFLGEMSLLEQAPRTATVRAVHDAELLVIQPGDFVSLLASSPGAAATILRVVAGRLRSTEASLMEQSKLASLGTLAAGLAHELNNPAAAIRRAADHMSSSLEALRRWTAELGRLSLTPEQATALGNLRGALDAAGGPPHPDPLESSLGEDRLGAWLDERGVDQAWEVAPPLIAHGFDVSRVEVLTAPFDGESLAVVMRWLAAALEARGLLDEIRLSARAISGIVQAVRSYAYLDQAPIQEVDIRQTLEDTLVILRHRLKRGITIERDFAPDLPRIQAFGSELNQVWTNLITNAIDAMEGKGILRLSARLAGGHLVVRVGDTGPGIPEESRSRLFDPFFTTKAPGAGTGLGLHIAHNIVVNRHRGRIALVESGPEGTTFEVRLPV